MRVPVDNDQLFYLRYGRGAPVLVMHGGPGLSHAYFRPYLDALGQTAELIYYDHRGNGRSSGRERLADVTLEQWASDAEALRVALKLGPVVVLGHGFGGFVAQQYARRYPQSLRGLILANTSPTLDYVAQMLSGAREAGSAASVAAVMACMSQPAPTDDVWRARWQQALPAYFFRYQTMYGAALSDGLGFCAQAYNRGMFDLAPQFSSIDWLRDVGVPALVLAGKHDWWAPPAEGALRLAHALPRAQSATFEHSGHYPFVEETTAFCHAVRTFLKSLPAQGA